MIEQTRLPEDTERELRRIVVAIDTAVTANANSDETGIVVVGVDHVNRFYVLDDFSGIYSPDKWA